MSEAVNETASQDRRAETADRGRRKVRTGYVVSDKMDKTVVVAVEDRVKHRLYGKVLRHTSRLKAHDEANTAGVGRPGPDHGDPAAERHQALAPDRDPRKGQVITTGVRLRTPLGLRPRPRSQQVRQAGEEPVRQEKRT